VRQAETISNFEDISASILSESFLELREMLSENHIYQPKMSLQNTPVPKHPIYEAFIEAFYL